MKKYSSLILISSAFLIGMIHFISESSRPIFIQEKLNGEVDDEMEIAGALEFEKLRKSNPFTGEIPFGAVMIAYSELKSRGFYQSYKSDFRDDVEGWNEVNDFFPTLSVTKIVYDPNETTTYYFCTGEGWFNADGVKGNGVFKSDDAGESWIQLEATNNTNFDYCQDIAIHPFTSDIYVATRSGGLQRSTDGGTTFQKVLGASAGSSRNSICDIEITSDGGVFVSIGIFEVDGVYYSSNGDSASFNKQGSFPSGNYRIELATAPSNPDVCYAIPCGTDFKIKGVYRTDDRGTFWLESGLPGGNLELAAKQAWYDLSLTVDPNNENILAAGGLNVWKSTDGAGTWQQISSGGLDSMLVRYMHVDQHEIVFQTSDIVYFTNDGGIYKCDNFSSDNPILYPVNNGYNVTQFYALAVHPNANDPRIIGGTQDNGSLMSLNNGTDKFKVVSGADGAFCGYNSENPEIFYTSHQLNKLLRFNNGGFELPDTITNPNLNDGNVLFINPIEMSLFDPDVIYQASNQGLWRLRNASTADTSGWEKATTTTGSISAIGVSSASEDLVFIGKNSSNGEIFLINNASIVDGGASPVPLDPSDLLPDASFFGTIYCSSIYVDPNDANHLFITYSNFGVKSIWETKNALAASPFWESVEGDLPDMPVYWSMMHPFLENVIYIATEMGIFYTELVNGSSTVWLPCTNFPVVRTDMLRYRKADNKIFAATHGRGIWEAQFDASSINPDLSWIERGPTNVGGRTRTVMIDPNDPTGKTLWAGSVAGGLWKTVNIDYVEIENSKAENSINIFPNPATSEISISLGNTSNANVKIEIFNVQGKLVETITNQTSSRMIKLPISQIPKGIYFISIKNNQSTTVKKIVLQ